jgi:transposase
MLADLIDEQEMANSLPEAAHAMFRLMLDLLAGLNSKIADLDKEIARRAREDEVSRRLMTIPGIGPISATAIAALAPPIETFAKGRDFAAWLGLTPLQPQPTWQPRGCSLFPLPLQGKVSQDMKVPGQRYSDHDYCGKFS